MPLPQRPSGSVSSPAARGPGTAPPAPSYELVKARVLHRLQDRVEALTARRMPSSLFQQTARQQVEQVVEVEAARLSRPDRARLAHEVFDETFGFGPLEELFRDPTAKEVMLLGAQA